MGSWAIRLFVKKYIAGMLHMTNSRDLKFSESFVDVEHWNAVATLGSLEELAFYSCKFLQGPANVEPEKRVKVKVSRLQVVNCIELRPLITAIDARYLRTLAIDNNFFDHVHWLSPSALTELYITIWLWRDIDVTPDVTPDYMQRLHAILMQAHQSLEGLTLFFDCSLPVRLEDIIRRMFDNPVWKNLPLLRSLKLIVQFPLGDTTIAVRQLSSLSVSHGS
jgi:hypothetical protein